VIDISFELSEVYDFKQSLVHACLHKSDYLVNVKKLYEAISESELGISATREIGNELDEMMLLSIKAEAQFLDGNPQGAHETISQASKIYEKQSKIIMYDFLGPYVAARLFIDVEQLRYTIRSGISTEIAHNCKQTGKSVKIALQVSRKYAPYKTKILRLTGLYYWLIGKQKKALKPDLSRTYFEVGKHLLKPQSEYKQLNGIDAKGYLEKAKKMFEDMDLQWDLDELDKIALDN